MAQIRRLTSAQLAYTVRCYVAGWGLEPISKRLPGIGVESLRFHLHASGIAIRRPGGYRKMATMLPPSFVKSRSKSSKRSAPPYDPRIAAWHRPIHPGWKVHGEVRLEPRLTSD
jgi:hypothetical protein